jgi:PEGA domain
MTKSFSFVTSVIVAAALAVPSLSAAQANRRSGGESSGESQSGGSRTGSGSGEVAVPRSSAPEPAPSPSPSSSSEPRTSGSGGATRTPSETGGGSVQGSARARGNQAVRGSAQARSNVPRAAGGSTYVTAFPAWSSLYGSYYGGYYNGAYGYASNPWGFYGGMSYWNRYGIYDPFLYDPYGYYGGFYGSPFGWSSMMTYGGASDYSNRREVRSDDVNGSIRLKVNPKTAKVYIDGALAGTADDFDGLGGHLDVEPGLHQMELRAEGFKTFTTQITVKANRTQTERISLKKP